MLQPVIDRSYLVEVNLTTVTQGQRYTFQDIPQLRNPKVLIQGIGAYSADQLGISPNLANVVPAAAAMNLIVTFAVGETEELYQIPYFDLISANNGGLIREFKDKRITLTKSYVTVLDATGLSAGQSAVFNFIYRNA